MECLICSRKPIRFRRGLGVTVSVDSHVLCRSFWRSESRPSLCGLWANTSELETGLSQVIGLANLLAVVLHHQASANSSTLSDMRQPSGAVCRLGIPTPAAQTAKTEYPPFRGARQRLLDGSRNLVSFIV